MTGATLVVAPATAWVGEIQMYAGTGVYVLDDILMSGLAGVYFRRLKVSAAVHPAVRGEYESKRFAYLQAAIKEIRVPDDAVVIGTHPTDVDLMDFEQVHAIRVADSGLREMSKLVYGDSLMLHVEYMSVLRVLNEAVDAWHHVVSWHEVPLWLMRQFGTHGVCNVGITAVRQRALLAELLQGEADASVWLEDDLHLDVPMRRGFLVADYDYLTVIRPKWRDAVVRSLGSAPPIEDLFRLPWFLVDPPVLNTLCFRPDVHGRPTASTRGQSLVEFVRSRLSSVYTTRELVGTWIGGLLCDDVTAVDTIRSLGFDTLVPVGVLAQRTDVSDATAIHVPPEYSWMYDAVLDVKVVPWDGPRRLDGSPKVDTGFESPWASTLALASLYAMEEQPRVAVSVVQLMQRIHTVGVGVEFISHLISHASDVMNDGPTYQVFDAGLTPLLPGYNYLFCFAPSMRYHVLDELGYDPVWVDVFRSASRMVNQDGLVSVDQLYAEVARAGIYAGRTVGLVYGDRRVGSGLNSKPGYCYDCIFKPAYKQRARDLLGSYPALGHVLDRRYRSWCIPRYLDRVFVTWSATRDMGIVLHFSLDKKGVPLRKVLYSMRDRKQFSSFALRRMIVGQQNDVCYSVQWYVAALIGWTLVGATIFALVVWLIYVRCRGRGGSGSRSRRY